MLKDSLVPLDVFFFSAVSKDKRGQRKMDVVMNEKKKERYLFINIVCLITHHCVKAVIVFGYSIQEITTACRPPVNNEEPPCTRNRLCRCKCRCMDADI